MSEPTLEFTTTALALSDRHIAELRASGLTDETLLDAGIWSTEGQEVAKLLGWQAKSASWGRGIAYPYRAIDGSDTDFVRIKPDFPRMGDGDRPIKYESPRGQMPRAYFPPRFSAVFALAPFIVLTEGEKKCLAAMQAGYCCIGLGGVWAFQVKRQRDDRGKVFGPRRLIPDLASLDWKQRSVIIIFDSDIEERPDLQIAECRLAELLTAKGAIVRAVRLPTLSGEKTGLDDFLVHHGDDAQRELNKLIESAQAPELPKVDGPMDLAKLIIDDAFVGSTGLRLRYWREDYWVSNGRCYEQVPTKELTARVLTWLDNHGFDARPRQASDIVTCLGSQSLVPFGRNMPCWLDGERHGAGWVAFENGLYRLEDPKNIQTVPHSARYFSPWVLDYPFEPAAECPTWLEFLNDVLDADSERIDLLQRWFGLLLVADTSFQKLLLLVGPPRAGKGTIVRVIVHLVGRANCASPTLSSLATRFGLSTLATKTVAVIPDAHIGRHVDGIRVAEALKSIVGEDPQDIERKYRDTQSSVRLPTRFVITCNELAHFTDPSGALAMRVSAIPFFNTYAGREDRTLEHRLVAERPGIANWAIVGLARLRAEGKLIVPAKSQSIHDNFKRLSSPIAAFMDDCVEQHASFSAPTSDVYAAWIGWCHSHGHDAGSSTRMGERLRSVNPAIDRSRVRDKAQDGDRFYVYKCIRLTVTGQQHMAEGYRILDLQGRDA